MPLSAVLSALLGINPKMRLGSDSTFNENPVAFVPVGQSKRLLQVPKGPPFDTPIADHAILF